MPDCYSICLGGVKHTVEGKVLYNHVSPYQRITVFRSKPFGKMLLLDGVVNLSEADAGLITDSAVVPALSVVLKRGLPKRALVLGGGDLQIAMRLALLGFDVVVVEIDQEVTKAAQRYFGAPAALSGVEVRYGDAATFLEGYNGDPFSLIFLDLTDPIGALAARVYSDEVLGLVKANLIEGGFVVGFADSPESIGEAHFSLIALLMEKFRYVMPYRVFIPSYFEHFVRFMASDGYEVMPWSVYNVPAFSSLTMKQIESMFFAIQGDEGYWHRLSKAKAGVALVGQFRWALGRCND